MTSAGNSGEEMALTILPGIAAVIRNGRGEVLLHRRKLGGGWAPPSGRVEPGESVLTALEREVLEETGFFISAWSLVGIYSDPTSQVVQNTGGRPIHFVTSVFLVHPMGAFSGNDEGEAWTWFAPNKLPDGLLPYARIWLDDALSLGRRVQVR